MTDSATSKHSRATRTPPVLGRTELVYIRDLDIEGRGIGTLSGGYTIFVPNALPGEEVKVQVQRVVKNIAFGEVQDRLQASGERVNPTCPYYPTCGGCNLMHLSYQGQLVWKNKHVRDCLVRLGGQDAQQLEPIIHPTLPSPLVWRYRNYAQFSVDLSKQPVRVGFLEANSHRVVPGESCEIQSRAADLVRRVFITCANSGMFTNLPIQQLLVRTSQAKAELMVALVLTEMIEADWIPFVKCLAEALAKADYQLTSFWLNENPQKETTYLGKNWFHVYGEKVIHEEILGLTYEVSPGAFFQVNSLQTESLYQAVLDACSLQGTEVVADLYCGSGTISLALARQAGQVIGVELFPQSIENARKNAATNGLTDRTAFYVGKAELVMPRLVSQGLKPDLVVVDPPRKGCDVALLQCLMDLEVEKIVYVSCNPATLARDVKILSQTYRLVSVQPVDMFPQGTNLETCILLVRK